MRDESGRVATRVRHLLDDQPGAPDGTGPAHGRPRSTRLAGAAAASWHRLRERLGDRMPVRLDPGRRAALAMGIAVLLAALITGAWVLAERPRAMAVSATVPSLTPTATPAGTHPVAPLAAASAPEPAGSGAADASAAQVVIDVAGKVRHPGLYRLPAGSRIDDAVRAAGGATRGVDLSALNLAAKVSDGQQILVGAPAAEPGGAGAAGAGAGSGGGTGGGTGGTAGSATGPVDLNTATAEQLQTLPGVGPVLAQHILDYRAAHGTFTGIDQLNDVPGIGDVKFAALRSQVSV